MNSPHLYKVLIIGCGNIAGSFDVGRASSLLPLSHAGAYTAHGGFSLHTCVDPDESKRKAFAQHWSVENQVASLSELNASPGTFDVISICSPTSLHDEHLVQALALRPRIIFCEKPLTTSLDAATRLVKDCREQGVVLVVNYSRNWDPSVQDVITQLQKGRWGNIRSIVGHYNKGIFNNGSHMVDLLLRLVGRLELVATTCPVYDFWENDPTIAALLTTVNSSVPVYLSPANAHDFAYFELEIICELGVLRMLSGGMGWQYREVVPSSQFEGYQTLNTVSMVEGRYMESMTLAVNELYSYLHSGTLISITGERALQVQELCTKIQREALMKRAPHNLS